MSEKATVKLAINDIERNQLKFYVPSSAATRRLEKFVIEAIEIFPEDRLQKCTIILGRNSSVPFWIRSVLPRDTSRRQAEGS